MLGKVIQGYFQFLQDRLNGFGIVFDSYYTQEIESYKHAMNNFSLRQMYDFNTLEALKLKPELLEKINNQSYNVLQYKYTPLRRSSIYTNGPFYYIEYIPATKDNNEPQLIIRDGNREVVELPKEQEKALREGFKAEQEKLSSANPNRVMLNDIQESVSVKFTPEITDTMKQTKLFRLALAGEFGLDCRFITGSEQVFSDFLVIYNTFLYKRNPASYYTLQELGSINLPINCKYSEVSSAQQIEVNQKGDLMEISFSVELSTFIFSSYLKQKSFVNNIDFFFESQSNNGFGR